MELTEDQPIERYAKQCMHCWTCGQLPYEYEWKCLSCGYKKIAKIKSDYRKLNKKNKQNRSNKICLKNEGMYL